MNLFSVIITTANRPPLVLKEAIDSVISQTYKNIEVIVVNDCPTSIYNIQIESLIHSYSNEIIYIKNSKSMGANYSRNLGADLSKGEVISFLDDDDYWDNNRVEYVMKEINAGYNIVYSDMYMFDEKTKKEMIFSCPNSDKQYETILAYNFLGGFSNVSFTKEIFLKVGKLDSTIVAYQDQDLFIRMVPYGKIKYIKLPLSYYRISNNSISLNSKKKLDGMNQIFNKYDNFYKKYPNSKKNKLKNDYVYALRNNWKYESCEIRKQLQQYVSFLEICKLTLLGKSKFIVRCLIKK